jgi:hypothetical protein
LNIIEGMKPIQVVLLMLAFAIPFSPLALSSQVLIGLHGEALPPEAERLAVAEELSAAAGRVEYEYQFINVILAEVPEEALGRLAASPYVKFIERDGEVTAPEPLDEEGLRLSFEWLPWGVDRIDAEVVHHPPGGLMASVLLLFGVALVGRSRLRRTLLTGLALAILTFSLVSCDLINIRAPEDRRAKESGWPCSTAVSTQITWILRPTTGAATTS